jgi:hypothetical protein
MCPSLTGLTAGAALAPHLAELLCILVVEIGLSK